MAYNAQCDSEPKSVPVEKHIIVVIVIVWSLWWRPWNILMDSIFFWWQALKTCLSQKHNDQQRVSPTYERWVRAQRRTLLAILKYATMWAAGSGLGSWKVKCCMIIVPLKEFSGLVRRLLINSEQHASLLSCAVTTDRQGSHKILHKIVLESQHTISFKPKKKGS